MPSDSITRAFQWDLARQVERLDILLKLLPRYAEWGYEELYLHLEDAVEYPSLPAVARPDAYSYRQFARLVAAATATGIRVVPIVNLLGHTQYLIKVPELRDLNELRDAEGQPLERGQICPLHPRTLEIAEKLLRDMAPFCTAGKVHVGLDESFHLGKCPRCRAEVARAGLAGHFAAHVNRLHQLTRSLGLRMGLWADMLALLPAAIPRLPRDVIAYDWYYYPFARHPRVELYNFAEVDLATPLRAQGIEYWGCPMNGAFRFEPLPVFGERMANIESLWRRCRRVGAAGFLITSWESNRLALEMTTVVDAAAASLWLDPEVHDPREMLARGFARVFEGIKVERVSDNAPGHDQGHLRRVRDPAFARGFGGQVNAPYPPEARHWAQAALAADAFPFSGYHRWQINERWDVCLGREGVAPYVNEEKALQKICKSRLAVSYKRSPPALMESCRAGSPDPVISSQPAAGSGDPALHLQGRSKPAPLSFPPALAASLAFRLYLARRDIFVRRAAEAVFQLRRSSGASLRVARRDQETPPYNSRVTDCRAGSPDPAIGRQSRVLAAFSSLHAEAAAFAAALRAGRTAARIMWRRSRDPRARGPNEIILGRDADRLREWRLWLKRAGRNPDIIWQATPVCGAWQLQFTVHNFAPALQKVVVEQQEPDGSWTLLHGLHLIEFRVFAAHPRTGIKREFSVPVAVGAPVGARSCRALAAGRSKPAPLQSRATEARTAAGSFPLLRLAVRGVGQVAISRVELTDGVVRLHPAGWSSVKKRILGQPAPTRGFPRVDWTRNVAAVEILFCP
jgi:hypothetical protein